MPQELLVGRRALEGLAGVQLLRDWLWDADHEVWTLQCRLSPPLEPSKHVPPFTDWYVLVDPDYPWGTIKFYPAKAGGIGGTFPHQRYNGWGADGVLWRQGDICLNTSVRALGRHGYDHEPYGAHERLRWHFERALLWLAAAAENTLLRPDEPFELPTLPPAATTPYAVAFSEGTDSFAAWQSHPEQVGLVDLALFTEKAGQQLLFVGNFRSLGGRKLVALPWGLMLRELQSTLVQAMWLRVPNPPVLPPWQVPTSWQELRTTCRLQDIDVDALLRAGVGHLRDGTRHLLLVGFPIPVRVGEAPYQMHWQALLLPVLSFGTKTAHGFRPNEKGYWQRDRLELLAGDRRLAWMPTENWHADQITTRGRVPKMLAAQKILLVGAGAVGSAIAELLVRAGVQHLVVLDGDRFEIGNLVRHSLNMDDLKSYKAAALAHRLNLTSPHAHVEAINAYFPPPQADYERVQKCTIILDCTAQDAVLRALESFPWLERKQFLSISLGLFAQRLFCFTMTGDRFSSATFQRTLNPWLDQERAEYAGQELPREGVGCWNPVFPARIDDVWMLAAVAVKWIEMVVAAPSREPDLVVFEQYYTGDVFAGVRRGQLAKYHD